MGITGKIWAGIVGIIAVVVLVIFLTLQGVMTSNEITPALGILAGIVILTLIFGGKD